TNSKNQHICIFNHPLLKNIHLKCQSRKRTPELIKADVIKICRIKSAVDFIEWNMKDGKIKSTNRINDILDDEESPSNQPSSTCRNRSISSIINEEIVSSARPTSNKRKLVVCNCPVCDGNLMDSRTKEIHDFKYQEYQDLQGIISSQVRQLEIGETSTPASAR
ncbi:hypothetical protein RhiirA4_431644, partial [Rhizophagus irregularis]